MGAISYRESRDLDVPIDRMFDLVADVERYPQFVPLLRDAEIIGRFDRGYETDQTLTLGLLTYRYRTRTQLDRPRSIVVTSDDQGFSVLDIRWLFTPTGPCRCRVDFSFDCELRSILFQSIGSLLVGQMALTMVNAFETRAREQMNSQEGLPR